MLAFTIIMIFSYTICIFIGLVAKSIPKNERLKDLDKDTQLGYVVIGCVSVICVLVHLIVYIIYLFNALNVDTLQYPTWVMLGFLVLSLVIGFVKSIINKLSKSNPENKTTLYGYLVRTITYIYFIYMLYVLIVGI